MKLEQSKVAARQRCGHSVKSTIIEDPLNFDARETPKLKKKLQCCVEGGHAPLTMFQANASE